MNKDQLASIREFTDTTGGHRAIVMKTKITRISDNVNPILAEVIRLLIEELATDIQGFSSTAEFDKIDERRTEIDPDADPQESFVICYGYPQPKFYFREKKNRLIEKALKTFGKLGATIDVVFLEINAEGHVTSAWQFLDMRLSKLDYQSIGFDSTAEINSKDFSSITATFECEKVLEELNGEHGLIDLANGK